MNPYEGWTVLELMGHRKIAGWVTEVEIAGEKMLRVDVPAPGMMVATLMQSDQRPTGPWSATQFYSGKAVYAMTPTTADVAVRFAANSVPEPVTRWELKEPTKAIPQLSLYDDHDFDREANLDRNGY